MEEIFARTVSSTAWKVTRPYVRLRRLQRCITDYPCAAATMTVPKYAANALHFV